MIDIAREGTYQRDSYVVMGSPDAHCVDERRHTARRANESLDFHFVSCSRNGLRETNVEGAISNLHKIDDILILDSAQYFPWLAEISDETIDELCYSPPGLSNVYQLWLA
jgi:hypothetical protein